MVMPLRLLVTRWWINDWPVRFWMMGAIAGAAPLAWAAVNVRALTLRCLGLCFLMAGLGGMLAFGAASALRHHGFQFHDHAWAGFGSSLVLYLPVCFVMEEVFFRGALDSFVHRSGDGDYWLSAAFVSVLWGWWHLPIVGVKSPASLLAEAIVLPLFHLPFGMLFSHYWRPERKFARAGGGACVYRFVSECRDLS